METGKKGKQFSMLRVALVLTAIFGVLAFLLLPALLRAHVGARRTRCLNNLKQVGLNLKQYALDNDEAFPWDKSEGNQYYRFFGKLHPEYVDNLELFYCPSSRDRAMRIENRGEDGDIFKESECKRGLSYAYGHNQGEPWTEEAPSATSIAADKYATQDYTKDPFPKGRYPNHWRGKTERIEIGRNIVYLDGSAKWDDNLGMLEVNPEWDVKWDIRSDMSITDSKSESDEDSDPEHDQTGPDWWSDPPDK